MIGEDDRVKKVRKEQKAYITDYLADNQAAFVESMEELRLMNPRRWTELYVEMSKMVLPKESKVNVNIGINKDFRELHMLATTQIGQKMIDGRMENVAERMEPIEDVDYEEIGAKPSAGELDKIMSQARSVRA